MFIDFVDDVSSLIMTPGSCTNISPHRHMCSLPLTFRLPLPLPRPFLRPRPHLGDLLRLRLRPLRRSLPLPLLLGAGEIHPDSRIMEVGHEEPHAPMTGEWV